MDRIIVAIAVLAAAAYLARNLWRFIKMTRSGAPTAGCASCGSAPESNDDSSPPDGVPKSP